MTEKFIVRNLADIEAIEKVPLAERIKAASTYELLHQGAAVDPEAVAIHFIPDGNRFDQPKAITYREFIKKINQTANLFHDLGVGATDVVTYLLPNLPQTHFVLWGAEAAGIANPVNPLLEAAAIADICRAAGTRVLVALGEVPGSDIWEKVSAIRKDIPTLEHIIRVQGPSRETEGIIGYEEKVETYPGDRLLSSRVIAPEDIASLYHTGGTTGRPKLARRSQANETALAWDLRVGMDLQPGEPVMCGLPLFHCNGTCITGLMPFAAGGSVVLLSAAGYRDPSIIKNFYKIVERYRPVFFSAVPTVLSVLLDIPVAGADISSLRHLVCGAAPLSVELFRRFEAHSGMKILEGYGLTESTCASAVNPRDGQRKIGSIGLRLPYQQMKIMVLDEAGNFQREARTNEIGVVCIQGPCVFKGYVEAEHNRGIWLDGGWFNTGDLGRQDEDGYFWLTGRKKELIIRGGHNINPAAIEEPLYKMPRIKLAAAVGRPDPHAGEVPVVYVEAVDGAALTGEEVLAWARQHIGERAAVPKEAIVIEHLPLTAVGKIFKPALRWDAVRRVYERELEALADLVGTRAVTVGEDPVFGTKAVLRVTLRTGTDLEDFRRRLAEQLQRYSVPYELIIVSDENKNEQRTLTIK